MTTAGVVSYCLQFRIGGRAGKTRTKTIGQHGKPWTPASARKRAEELYAMVKRGIDPVEAERDMLAAKLRQAAEENELAFANMAERYLKGAVDGQLGEASSIRSGFVRMLVPKFGKTPVDQIKRRDVSTFLEDLKESKSGSAANAHKYLRQMFNWAVDKGFIEVSPIAGMKPPVAKNKRGRFHEKHELLRLWEAACDLEAIGDIAGSYFKMVILTGRRNEEMAGLRWSEVNLEERRITLGASRMKMGEAHLTPLSSLSMEVLQRLRRSTNGNGFVFSTSSGETGLSGKSFAKTKIDQYVGRRVSLAADQVGVAYTPMEPWVMHDLRRTLTTRLAEIGIPKVVRDSLLSHGSGKQKGLAGTYDQWEYYAERKEALEAYAKLIMELSGRPDAFPGGKSLRRIPNQQGKRNDLDARD